MEILNGGNSVFDRLGTVNVIEKKKKRYRLSSCSYNLNAAADFQLFHHHPNKKPKPAPPSPSPPKLQKLCKYWIQGNCSFGDNCRYLHCWYTGSCFSLLSQLPAHNNPITGIAYPLIGSSSGIAYPLIRSSSSHSNNEVYCSSKDGSVSVWDCGSGQCVHVVHLSAEIGCLISEGEWVFVGIPNSVQAWNTNTNTHLNLNLNSTGQVHSLAMSNDKLFAGTHDGSISVWLEDPKSNAFLPLTSLKGHKSAVVSLILSVVDDKIKRLYSGSMDSTICIWDLLTMQCVQVLSEHTSGVMSVLCWDQYLISCSLDQTIKVWGGTDEGRVELVYNHKQQHGVLALFGVHDFQHKPLLMCSSDDNVLRLYELPSFKVRGKIFSTKEIKAIGIGSGGLFFTGDETGLLSVWKLSDEATD